MNSMIQSIKKSDKKVREMLVVKISQHYNALNEGNSENPFCGRSCWKL